VDQYLLVLQRPQLTRASVKIGWVWNPLGRDANRISRLTTFVMNLPSLARTVKSLRLPVVLKSLARSRQDLWRGGVIHRAVRKQYELGYEELFLLILFLWVG